VVVYNVEHSCQVSCKICRFKRWNAGH